MKYLILSAILLFPHIAHADAADKKLTKYLKLRTKVEAEIIKNNNGWENRNFKLHKIKKALDEAIRKSKKD